MLFLLPFLRSAKLIICDLKSDYLSSHVCATTIIHTVKTSMVSKLTVAFLKGQSWHILNSWTKDIIAFVTQKNLPDV